MTEAEKVEKMIQEKNPFSSFYERVNIKSTSKGILSPDVTVKYENADEKTVVRYDKDLQFEVSGTENQKPVQRAFELVKEFRETAKAQGYTTCFDEQ